MGQGFGNPRVGVNLSAGTVIANSGTIVLSNSNNISFGISLTNSSYIITASYAGVSGIGGLVGGTQTATSGTVIFSNSNNITFGMSLSNIITARLNAISSLSTPTGGAGQAAFSNFAGVYWGANGATITANIGASFFQQGVVGLGLNSIAIGGSNLSFQRVSVPLQVNATEMDLLGNLTVAASGAGSYTLSAALYTFSASTASLASSTSIGYTFNSGTTVSSSLYGGNSGTLWYSIPLATWNVAPGEYMLALMGSMTGAGAAAMNVYGGSMISIVGAYGGGNQSATFDDGLYSVMTTAFPASVHLSAINQTGASVLGQPFFRIYGT